MSIVISTIRKPVFCKILSAGLVGANSCLAVPFGGVYVPPAAIVQHIASGFYGKSAFLSGNDIICIRLPAA